MRHPRSRLKRGTNQFKQRQKGTWKYWITFYILSVTLIICFAQYFKNEGMRIAYADAYILSPIPAHGMEIEAKKVEEGPSEKEQIIAYITRLWEKHGTNQVVHAINCFYSESGLRTDAVGQNSDAPKSKDWNVAQLNDYWHDLTDEQKTDIYAGLDKAYAIWIGRGAENGGWSAWYAESCN